MAGRSRSATILIAFIIKNFGFTTEKALESLILKRPIVEPNKYFIEQLENYYDQLYKNEL
jgi:dual specificity phosphatase 12